MGQPMQVPTHLRTFDAALAHVREERRAKLKREFPPWIGQFHPLISGIGGGLILLCLCYAWPPQRWYGFGPLIFSLFLCDVILRELGVPHGIRLGGPHSGLPLWRTTYSWKQRVNVLLVGAYWTVILNCPLRGWLWLAGLIAVLAALQELVSTRHMDHPYYRYRDRKKALAAIDTSLDAKQAAVDLLIQWCDEAAKESKGYRETGKLRIATELRDLKDYVAEPNTYKGMTLLHKNPAHYNGAVSTDEDERAEHWYAALVQSADDELRERAKNATI